jgi:hypothetical protein
MNIVQIANDIKGYPLDLLKQYANGANPEIPPYIALGEIERQNKMNERSAMQQKSAQGPQPSVKDQIEQKAGLMALQAQQQQQAQQQMMQQARSQPMPVPAGTPQPAEQEQATFADGGMAQLPIGSEFFQYGSGGIIAFDGTERSDVPAPQETPEERKRRVMAEILAAARDQQSKPNQGGIASTLPAEANRIPGLNDPSFLQAAKKGLEVPTQEDLIAAEKARNEAMGVTGKYGEKAEEGINRQREMYKEATANRGIEGLMATLGGIRQGSLAGAGPAYLGQKSAERTADLAQLEKENKMLAEIEAARRTEGLGRSVGIGTELSRARERAATTGASLFGTQTQAGTQLTAQDMSNRTQKDIAETNRASAEKIAGMNNATQMKIHELDRSLRERLHSTPSPTIDSQAIAEYIKQGLSPTEAYERVKSISSGFKGEMTQDQAADNVAKFLDSPTGMMYMSEQQKKAKEAGLPFDAIDFRRQLIQREMANSARTSVARPSGAVDSNNPLLR